MRDHEQRGGEVVQPDGGEVVDLDGDTDNIGVKEPDGKPAAEFESLDEGERRAWKMTAHRLCEEYLVADYNVHIEPREDSDE